jgi:predicted HD phosphohydrolase
VSGDDEVSAGSQAGWHRLPAVAGGVDDVMAALAAAAGARDAGGAFLGGDEVDIAAHSLQCADRLATTHPDDVELQLAGLCHDLGHLLLAVEVVGEDDGHGPAGATFVRGVLGDRVADLVALHVPAKRYLAATDPAHRATFSTASTASLASQGGPMTAPEVAAFRRHPLAAAAVALRRADDDAKEPDRPTSDLDHWRSVLDAAARRAARGRATGRP